MLGKAAKWMFGSANDRVVKTMQKDVDAINALEPAISALSDDELRAQTAKFRARLQEGEALDTLLPEAFATVREVAKRTLGMRHFDVQLIGGMVLHKGMITEMKTGEGKTLVATLAAYLNALPGKGVHIITVNDYLASRDAQWMGEIYQFLGLSVGCITGDIMDEDRQRAYAADITYGTNNEFGFDYLRDHIAPRFDPRDLVQRPFNFAIIDEVDSILIDEARTPLIISGPTTSDTSLYVLVDKLIPKLIADDYELEEKHKAVTLTDKGAEHMEQLLQQAGILQEGGLYDLPNMPLVHHANQALRAHKLFQRDTDYIIKNNEVMLIDEFTGRIMDGRRLSEGLHQAIEAKENVPIQTENQTLASITFQNYFRLYPKLAGMTGTAMTEAAEFEEIYNLPSVEIPTNVPVQRIDHDDEIYRTVQEKFNAIVKLIKECHDRKQPILVGTVSIEKSEKLSEFLKKEKVPHHVLNARHHEKEASIIAQAGEPGAVTIATNMAGRGTDIKLGGNLEMRVEQELGENPTPAQIEKIKQDIAAKADIVKQAGGLYVIGTERHESRRIDNQLRGRSGRQGDAGASKFFLSLEDDLMRIFGMDKKEGLLSKLGLQDGEAITHPWISKAMEKAQQKVEARNFDIRKQLLKEDDVMNDQRKVVYEQRREIMFAENVTEMVAGMRHDVIEEMVDRTMPPGTYPEQWEESVLQEETKRILNLDAPVADWVKEEGVDNEKIIDRLKQQSDELIDTKRQKYKNDLWQLVEKELLLRTLDQTWKDHLLSLDHLKHGTRLSAFGQKDPLMEFKREAFNLFHEMLGKLRENITLTLTRVELEVPTAQEVLQTRENLKQPMRKNHPAPEQRDLFTGQRTTRAAADQIDPADPQTWGRIRRNDVCPCGSGKKFKHCHGQLTAE